jgi:hypothetical protein
MSVTMSVKTFTCDRCGAAETVDAMRQPKDWIGVVVVKHPLGSAADDDLMRWHLCHACAVVLYAFVRPAPREETTP